MFPEGPSEERVRWDMHGTILADVPCLQCGYNLRGTQMAGECPECGHSTLESVLAARRAEPSLLRSVGTGVFFAAFERGPRRTGSIVGLCHFGAVSALALLVYAFPQTADDGSD